MLTNRNFSINDQKLPKNIEYLDIWDPLYWLRLVQPVHGTNWNITTDNWFTSIPLIETLQKEQKLTLVGTLKKNKREIPPEFLPKKTREEKSFIFGFQHEITLVSYYPNKDKVVLIASSMQWSRNGRSGNPKL